MADYTHTIDRWDEATGENLIVQICQHRRLLARARAGGGEALAKGQDYAAEPDADSARPAGASLYRICMGLHRRKLDRRRQRDLGHRCHLRGRSAARASCGTAMHLDRFVSLGMLFILQPGSHLSCR